MKLATKSERQLFVILNNAIEGDRETRLAVLDELKRRGGIHGKTRGLKLVMEVAEKFAFSNPEGPILAELFSGIVTKHPMLFRAFLRGVEGRPGSYLPAFAARNFKDLSQDWKSDAIPSLVSALMNQKSVTAVSNEIIGALTSVENEGLRGQVSKALESALVSPHASDVYVATRILAKTGDSSICKQMLVVLQRSLLSWYEVSTNEIQDNVTLYLTRYPTEEALPLVRKLLAVKRTELVMEMLRKFQFKSTATMLEDLVDELISVAGTNPDRDFLYYATIALSNLDTSFVDLPRLLSHDVLLNIHWSTRFSIKKIFLSKGQSTKPVLFELLKSPDANKYSFAKETLTDMGVTLDEMSSQFKTSPSTTLYEFFYANATPEKIWAERSGGSLGGSLKQAMRRFEFFLISLLQSLNFLTLYVDPSNKAGVDVVALSPTGNYMLVVGGTTASLKDDIPKLQGTVKEMREKMQVLMDRYNVYSMICVASPYPVGASEARLAKESGIIILDQKRIEEVLIMSKTGRTTQDFMQYLKEREMDPLPGVFPNILGLSSP